MRNRAGRAIAIALAAVGLTAVYLALPRGQSADAIPIIAPLIGMAMIAIGVARNMPRRTLGWGLIALYLATEFLSSAVWIALYGEGKGSFPSVADVLQVIGVIPLFVGVGLVSVDATNEEGSFGSFEIAIVGIATFLCVWLGVIEPFMTANELPFGRRIWAAGIPLVVALAAAMAIRTSLRARLTSPSSNLLAVGLILLLIDDSVSSVLALRETLEPGGLALGLAIAPPLLIGASALDRSMARQRPIAPRGGTDAGVGRIIGLSVAALTPLTVLVALTLTNLGSRATMSIASLCALVVVVIALAQVWRLIGTVRVLSERRGQDRLAAMVEHSSDIVALIDEFGKISYISPGLVRTLGHRQQDWIGRPIADLVAVEDTAFVDSEVRRLIGSGQGQTIEMETTLVRVDGHRRHVEATVVNLIGGDAVDGLVATFRDVTEQRAIERQLSHRAFHDELTGLANRALFLDRMDHALRVARLEDDPVVVLFVDLDDFKTVNDALGHTVGDELLRTIAERMRAVSGSGDTPARLGGDEFALLLEDHGGVDRALDVAETLLDALRQPMSVAGRDLVVMASVGVAVATPNMTTSTLLRDADLAMYEAKRAGKGQIKIFDPAMRLIATRHLEYRSELGSAIDNGDLRLVYQPIIDLRSGEVLGAEALVRWHHPTHGEIAPAAFLPIAERSGLILPMGRWVLDESLRQARRWQHHGPRSVSVNISPVQLRAPDFVDEITAALAIHEFPPELVTLEITEATLADEIDSDSAVLFELRAIGVRLAVDDYGTGTCSLSHLQRCAVDVLKIDKQFIDELGDDPHRPSLVRTVLQLTATLDIQCLAEGIERTVQLSELRRLGCSLGQGYLLSPPLESEELSVRFGAPAEVVAPPSVSVVY